ncbi:MAG: cobalamin biosynthesis protein CobD [Clostridia bacterium]|nr:cobalamin biosynthesis protein CobD [Clostridia bacterium]
MMFFYALLAGFCMDLLFGDPEWLCHPVRLIGKYISFAEKKLRAGGGNLRLCAVLLTLSAVLLTMGTAGLILLAAGRLGKAPLFLAMALLDWMGIAAKSMTQEARQVQQALSQGIGAGRRQVARIVGRDTQSLSEEEVIKATVETVAENTTDGVVSPMIYAALGGPVLLWGFKAASTLDSMVGYMDEKYRDIGWSSARLDDVLNYLPARLTALLMCAAAWVLRLDARVAWRIVKRDHANHSSPNCAWSEAAAAGALRIQLGGTHSYFGKDVFKPTIGDPDRPAERQDIGRANAMLVGTALLAMGLIALLTLLLSKWMGALPFAVR